MESCDNIYDKIQELLGCIPGNVSILEKQINADVQTEYYDYASKMKEISDPEEVLKNREMIFGPGLTIEAKKLFMVRLASLGSIEAYRTLEKYSTDGKDQLNDWAILAMQESRLLLESKILDESQILISTGLGGKGLKLRYFAVFISTNRSPLTSFQKKILQNEVEFAMKKFHGELEEIRIDYELCSILCIIPLQVSVKRLFDELMAECNQYGNFIYPDYIITNVKVIPNHEIRKMIGSSRKNKTRKE